jgi:hypothetical protein
VKIIENSTHIAADVLQTAQNLVTGDRAKQHGDKLENHKHIARLWSAYLGVPISAHQVTMLMVLLKVARTKTGSFNLDDFVDAAGYVAISAEIWGKDNFVVD